MQFYAQGVVVFVMTTILGGVGPVMWLSARLGHKVIVPVWKDPLWGPILLAWCLFLYALFFAFCALVRRRKHLAIHDRGFRIGRRTVLYEDIRTVRLARSDGKIASAIAELNAAIPLEQNHEVAQLRRNSSAMSMALVLRNGRVVPLNNFFACYASEALECVVHQIARKLKESASDAGGRVG